MSEYEYSYYPTDEMSEYVTCSEGVPLSEYSTVSFSSFWEDDVKGVKKGGRKTKPKKSSRAAAAGVAAPPSLSDKLPEEDNAGGEGAPQERRRRRKKRKNPDGAVAGLEDVPEAGDEVERPTFVERNQKVLACSAIVFISSMAGMFIFMGLEDFSALDSLYLTLTVLTTVGYGDLYPVTSDGKGVMCIFAFLGLALFGFVLSAIATYSQEKMAHLMEKMNAVESSDPYVAIPSRSWIGACFGSHYYETPHILHDLNPRWDNIEWEVPLASYPDTLPLEVYDYDPLRDDIIGSTSLAVSDIPTGREYSEFTLALAFPHGSDHEYAEVDSKLLVRARKDSSTIYVHIQGCDDLPIMDHASELMQSTVAKNQDIIGASVFLLIVLVIGAAIFSLQEEWRFYDGLYWACITSTTIGYGDFSPLTRGGRGMFLLYVFIVLGAGGYFLGMVQEKTISRATQAIMKKTTREHKEPEFDGPPRAVIDAETGETLYLNPISGTLIGAPRPEGEEEEEEEEEEDDNSKHLVKLFVVQLGIVVCLLVFMAMVMRSLEEGWTFFDGVYFATVTLTSVGYGDLLPTEDSSKAFVMIFSLVGLAGLSAFTSILSEVALQNAETDPSKIRKEYAKWNRKGLLAKFYDSVGFQILVFVGLIGFLILASAATYNRTESEINFGDDPTCYSEEEILESNGTLPILDASNCTLVDLGLSVGDAAWLTTISITTIGFGDISPATRTGRSIFIVGIFVALMLVTHLLYLIQKASAEYVRTRYTKIKDRKGRRGGVNAGARAANMAAMHANIVRDALAEYEYEYY